MDICQKQGIERTPIMAYIDREILEFTEFAVDGTLICRETGFVYEYPKVTQELIKECIEQFQLMNLFPY
jgi:hypothetical protein